MIRYYIVPKELRTMHGSWQWYMPKYFGSESNWSATDYGGESIYLVKCDTSDADHAILVSRPDVIAWPELDQKPNNLQVTQLQNAFEAINIPGDWINGNLTYREILTTMVKMWQFHQRVNGLGVGRIFANANNNTEVGALPAPMKQAFQNAVASFNWDTGYLQDNLSLRQVFKQMSSFFYKPVTMGAD